MNIILIRTCVSCGIKKPKDTFIRINRTPKSQSSVNVVVLEPKDSLKFYVGRSAYLCPDTSCFKKIKKTRRLEKNLSLKFDEEIYFKIEEIIKTDK